MTKTARPPKRPTETGGARLRQQISAEAARLLAEEGGDYQSAKQKALSRLGLPRHTRLPDNREIEQALADYLNLFQADELRDRRQRWQQTAIDAMALLEDFRPRLVGDALSGNLTRFSRVQLLVRAAPEPITLFLADANIPHQQHQRRMRTGPDRYRQMQTFRFMANEVPVELISIESDALSHQLLCPIDGKPMRQAGLAELRQRADSQS